MDAALLNGQKGANTRFAPTVCFWAVDLGIFKGVDIVGKIY
jgi:hypothetical protein